VIAGDARKAKGSWSAMSVTAFSPLSQPLTVYMWAKLTSRFRLEVAIKDIGRDDGSGCADRLSRQ